MKIKPKKINTKPKLALITTLLICILSVTTAQAALTAKTANTIQGTKPKLSDDRVSEIIAGSEFKLLGVKFGDKEYFTESDISRELNNLTLKFGSLSPKTLTEKLGTGTDVMAAAYKDPTVGIDVTDNDGDEFTVGSLSGTASADWYYKDGTEEKKIA